MDFRDVPWETAVSVLRQVAASHPLQTPGCVDHDAACPSENATPVRERFMDPLGAMGGPIGDAEQTNAGPSNQHISPNHVSTWNETRNNEDGEPATGTEDGGEVELRNVLSEWSIRRRAFVQSARQSDGHVVRVKNTHAPGGVEINSFVATNTTAGGRLSRLNDVTCLRREETSKTMQAETIEKLQKLITEINNGWADSNRLEALLHTVKVASLLDQQYPVVPGGVFTHGTTSFNVGKFKHAVVHQTQFYPILFGLVADVLDKAGDSIYHRVFQKAQFDDDTHKRHSVLADDFTSDDVNEDARKTCRNWFRKIDAVEHLVPRLYLQLATMACHRFVANKPPFENLERIISQIKTIEDPLVKAFITAYASKTSAVLTTFRAYRTTHFPKYSRYLMHLKIGTLFRDSVTSFVDGVDRFDFVQYSRTKRNHAKHAERLAKEKREEEGDLIDALDYFLDSMFDDQSDDDDEEGDGEGDAKNTKNDGFLFSAEHERNRCLRDITSARLVALAPALEWTVTCFVKRCDENALCEFLWDVGERKNANQFLVARIARVMLQRVSNESTATHAERLLALVKGLSRGAHASSHANEYDDDHDDDTKQTTSNDLVEMCFCIGARLAENPPSSSAASRAAFQTAWEVVCGVSGRSSVTLGGFLKCADAWLEFNKKHVDCFFTDTVSAVYLAAVAKRVGEEKNDLDVFASEFVERIVSRSLRSALECDDRDREQDKKGSSQGITGSVSPFLTLATSPEVIALTKRLTGSSRVLWRVSALCGFSDHKNAESFFSNPKHLAWALHAARVVHEDSMRRGTVTDEPDTTNRRHVDVVFAWVDCAVRFHLTAGRFGKAVSFLETCRATFVTASDETLGALCLRASWLCMYHPAAKHSNPEPSTRVETFKARALAFCNVTCASVANDTTRALLHLQSAIVAVRTGFHKKIAAMCLRNAIGAYTTGLSDARSKGRTSLETLEFIHGCAGLICQVERGFPLKRREQYLIKTADGKGRVSKTVRTLARFVEKVLAKRETSPQRRVGANLAMVRLVSFLATKEPGGDVTKQVSTREETSAQTSLTNSFGAKSPLNNSSSAKNSHNLFLLELTHLYAQRAVDLCETVDAGLWKSAARTETLLDAAGTFSVCFRATGREMRNLIDALLERALEDCPEKDTVAKARIGYIQGLLGTH